MSTGNGNGLIRILDQNFRGTACAHLQIKLLRNFSLHQGGVSREDGCTAIGFPSDIHIDQLGQPVDQSVTLVRQIMGFDTAYRLTDDLSVQVSDGRPITIDLVDNRA